LTASTSSEPMLNTSVMIAMIVFLMATWWVLHRIAHVIVTEYGLLGGLLALAVIYVTGIVMDRYGL
jgi:hypothetical protein